MGMKIHLWHIAEVGIVQPRMISRPMYILLSGFKNLRTEKKLFSNFPSGCPFLSI